MPRAGRWLINSRKFSLTINNNALSYFFLNLWQDDILIMNTMRNSDRV